MLLHVLLATLGAERIIGGSPASIQRWNFIVRLFQSQSDVVGFCAGALIELDMVVTAAHCAVMIPTHVGAYHEEVGSMGSGCASRRRVQSIEIHPEYDQVLEKGNDVAILRIEAPSCVDALLGPSTIGVDDGSIWTDGPLVHTRGEVAGWGARETDGSDGYSPHLMAVEVNLFRRSQCDSFFGYPLAQTNLCAGFYMEEPAVDACFGDSGGPLVVFAHDVPVLVGIVSWGLSVCAVPSHPGVYVQIGKLRSFLERYTERFVSLDTATAGASDPCACKACTDASEVDCGCVSSADVHADICYVESALHCESAQTSWLSADAAWRPCDEGEQTTSAAARTPSLSLALLALTTVHGIASFFGLSRRGVEGRVTHSSG